MTAARTVPDLQAAAAAAAQAVAAVAGRCPLPCFLIHRAAISARPRCRHGNRLSDSKRSSSGSSSGSTAAMRSSQQLLFRLTQALETVKKTTGGK